MPRGQNREPGETGPGVSLSGYQPPKDQSGLYLIADDTYDHFMKALANGDRTGEGLRVVVVGVLEAVSAKIPRPGVEKDPMVELRFVKIEPVIPRDEIGDLRSYVVDLLQQLNNIRRGESPDLFEAATTDSPGEGDDSPPGEETSRSRRRGGALAPVPDASYSAE